MQINAYSLQNKLFYRSEYCDFEACTDSLFINIHSDDELHLHTTVNKKKLHLDT